VSENWCSMATVISNSPEETSALAEAWGREAAPGWVIGLSGDLGAGKTQLVRGLARGLGVKEKILSPTFGLIHQYHSGRLSLYHMDLYRLDSGTDVVRAGLAEFLPSLDGVTVVEWVERCGLAHGAAPTWIRGARYRQVTISSIDESGRRIEYEDFGG